MAKTLALATALFLLVGLLLFGCGGGGNSLYALSILRIGKLNRGLLLYTNDYDAVAPPGAAWMDSIEVYVNDPTAFRSPAVEALGYGYALSDDIAGHGVAAIPNSEAVPTILDSTDLSRNAVVDPATQPAPPRYGASNTIAYLDGHVKDELINPGPISLYERSRQRIKSSNIAMLMYSSDYDDYLPLADQWMDALYPYTQSNLLFRSPKVEVLDPTKYGYALNSAIAGQNLTALANPANMLSLFDSTVLTRNATASTSTLPNPPRYDGLNTLAYADGHVP